MNKTELLAVIYNNTSKDSQRDDIIDAVEKYLSASNFWVETDKGSFAIYKIESGASNPFISYVKQLAIPIESTTPHSGECRSKEEERSAEEIFEYMYQSFKGTRYSCEWWDEFKDMGADIKECVLAAMEEYASQSAPLKEDGWVSDKPDKECVFVTANKYVRNDEDLLWDYSVWQIKKLIGEDEAGDPALYLGLLNGDGEEWGPLEDLSADLYKVIAAPPTPTKQ